jgi:hypothetical protein
MEPVMTHRREILAAAAGALLLETVAGVRVLRAQPAAADPTAPWRAAAASTHADWRVRAAGWAVLAPNPHNRQPWLIELARDGSALLRCDLDRRLPATDPHDRQITIGLGGFAELFRMAAAEQGVALAVEPFPEGTPEGRLDARPVARLARVAGAAAPDALFAQALARRSAKQPFDTARPVGAAALARIMAAAGTDADCRATEEPGLVAALRDLTLAAWMTEMETKSALMETVNLMRLGSAAVAANPDGVSIAGPGLDDLVAQGVLTREGFATPGAPAHQAMVDRYRAMLFASPAYVWTVSADDSKQAALSAGRHWLCINLATAALGLGLHPVSQALQEFPEMAADYARLHERLGVAAPTRIQMLGRLGHLPAQARVPGPTPRWPVESRIVGG